MDKQTVELYYDKKVKLTYTGKTVYIGSYTRYNPEYILFKNKKGELSKLLISSIIKIKIQKSLF